MKPIVRFMKFLALPFGMLWLAQRYMFFSRNLLFVYAKNLGQYGDVGDNTEIKVRFTSKLLLLENAAGGELRITKSCDHEPLKTQVRIVTMHCSKEFFFKILSELELGSLQIYGIREGFVWNDY